MSLNCLTCSIGNYKFRGEIIILILTVMSIIAFFTLFSCTTCTIKSPKCTNKSPKEGFAQNDGYYSTKPEINGSIDNYNSPTIPDFFKDIDFKPN